MTKCFLCDSEIGDSSIGRTSGPIIYNVFCEECGPYRISDVLMKMWVSEDKNAIIWYIKNGNKEVINEKNIDYIRQEYKKYLL